MNYFINPLIIMKSGEGIIIILDLVHEVLTAKESFARLLDQGPHTESQCKEVRHLGTLTASGCQLNFLIFPNFLCIFFLTRTFC